MPFLKLRGDGIFTGSAMLTADRVIIMRDDGRLEDIIKKEDAGDDVQVIDGLLCPGFINAHCHLELSHMQGVIPPGTGIVNFLVGVIQRRFTDKRIIESAISIAEEAMINEGIVAAGDICNTTDTIKQKQKKKIAYLNFIEATGFAEDTAELNLQRFEKIRNEFLKNDLAGSIITPHAPYSVSKKLMKLINNISQGKTLSIHNQESEAENIFFETGEGDLLNLFASLNIDVSSFIPSAKSSLQTIAPFLNKPSQLLFVHNIYTDKKDIDVIRNMQPDCYWCICPNANLYIDNVLPDVDLLCSSGCKIVVGTDSLASNNKLSMIEELKTISNNFPGIPLSEMLTWITINGAKALQMQDAIGSFEKEKFPGVVAIEKLKDGKLTAASFSKKIL